MPDIDIHTDKKKEGWFSQLSIDGEKKIETHGPYPTEEDAIDGVLLEVQSIIAAQVAEDLGLS